MIKNSIKKMAIDTKGSMMVFAIMLIISVTVIGITVVGISTGNFRMSASDRDYQSVYYVAEAGMNIHYDVLKQKVEELDALIKTGTSNPQLIRDQIQTFILQSGYPKVEEFFVENQNDNIDTRNVEAKAVVSIDFTGQRVEGNGDTILTYTIKSVGTLDSLADIGEDKTRTVATTFDVTYSPGQLKATTKIDGAVYIGGRYFHNSGGGTNITGGLGFASGAQFVHDSGGGNTIDKLRLLEGQSISIPPGFGTVTGGVERIDVRQYPTVTFPTYPSYSYKKISQTNLINDLRVMMYFPPKDDGTPEVRTEAIKVDIDGTSVTTNTEATEAYQIINIPANTQGSKVKITKTNISPLGQKYRNTIGIKNIQIRTTGGALLPISDAEAGSSHAGTTPYASYDGSTNTFWRSENVLNTAWIEYTLQASTQNNYEVILANGDLRSLHLTSQRGAPNTYRLDMGSNYRIDTIEIANNYTLEINVGNENREIVVDTLNITNGNIVVIGTGKLKMYVRNLTMGQIVNMNVGRPDNQFTIYYNGNEIISRGGTSRTIINGSFVNQRAQLRLEGIGVHWEVTRFFSNHNGQGIYLSGEPKTINGLIYAPNAQLWKTGENLTINGALILREFYNESGSSRIIFDEKYLNDAGFSDIIGGEGEPEFHDSVVDIGKLRKVREVTT